MNGGDMIFNPGFSRLKMMADSAGIPMIVTLHATLPELKAGAYDSQGEEIIEWCAVNNIPIIRDLDEGITSKMYRDGIHINDAGQKLHAAIMEKYILKVLQGAVDR